MCIFVGGVCPVLAPVENGIWHIQGYNPGSSAKLSCKDGFNIAGNDVNIMKVCKEQGEWVGQDGQCIGTSDPAALSQGGLPYLIIAISLILCALLLATIVLVIVILVYRKRKQGVEDLSPGHEPKISFGALDKPLTGRAVEIQPELSNLEPRLDQRAYFMQYGQLPQRRFVSLPMEAQRRLIPVPEEEGDAELTSPDGQYTIDQAELELATGIQDWVQEYEPMISKERPK